MRRAVFGCGHRTSVGAPGAIVTPQDGSHTRNVTPFASLNLKLGRNSVESLTQISFHASMSLSGSPLLAVPARDWHCPNELAFGMIVTPDEAPEMAVVGEWVFPVYKK